MQKEDPKYQLSKNDLSSILSTPDLVKNKAITNGNKLKVKIKNVKF